jgi:hypothetical protein
MNKQDVEEVMKDMIKSYDCHISHFSPDHPFRKRLEDNKNIYQICLALVQSIKKV